MPQAITPPLGGIQIALGLNGVGQVKVLTGVGDPNQSTTDSSAGDLSSAAVGSIYLRQDAPDSTTALYVKTAFASGASGSWTAK